MTYSPGVPLASAWRPPVLPPPDTRMSVHDLVAHLEGKTGDLPAAVLSAKIEAQLKKDGEKLKKEGSDVLKVLLLGQAGSGVCLFFLSVVCTWVEAYILMTTREICNVEE